MGYSETMCQLCGVSFAIARYRRPDEPHDAAWGYDGNGYNEIYDPEGMKEECKDCVAVPHDGVLEMEHVAGQNCKGTQGYSGWRISLDEMKGCRAIQCLAWKEKDWKPEEDDQDFELDSHCFLTGIGDGSPDEGPLENIKPPRHGVDIILTNNVLWSDDPSDWGLPFHPTCFEIFTRMSKERFGHVDVDGLWNWRSHEKEYEDFFELFPRDPAVKAGHEQWWDHAPGFEYLAANPINIPGLQEQLKQALESTETEPWNTTSNASPADKLASNSSAGTDLLAKLPTEVSHMILHDLSSSDIANLRMASRSFRQIPSSMFRKLLAEEKEWLWEVQEMPTDSNWYRVWMGARENFGGLKGLTNRRRICVDIEEILNRIEKYSDDRIGGLERAVGS